MSKLKLISASMLVGAALYSQTAFSINNRSTAEIPANLMLLPASQVDNAVEYNALKDLYEATAGASWNNQTNWLTSYLDAWYGLTVKNDDVKALNLKNNNLVGHRARLHWEFKPANPLVSVEKPIDRRFAAGNCFVGELCTI